jgi:hypothetical protein
MDKIILDIEQINKLLSWRDKHKELVRQYKTIITDGIIEVTDTKRSMSFHVDGNRITFDVPQGFTATIEILEDKGYRIVTASIEDHAAISDTLALYFAVTAYIYYFKPEIKTRQYTYRESIKQTKSKQNYIKTVTVKGIIYTIGKINVNRKPPQKYIDAWNVRGHARHLQSGKVIYVRPYQKGKGKVTDKVYKIKP